MHPAAYHVEFRPEALEDLEDLDKMVAQRILRKIKWLEENFENIMPQALKGEFKGLYKLRAGDYRILYTVNNNDWMIIVHLIKHRKEVYR